jgi:hypothetical protein
MKKLFWAIWIFLILPAHLVAQNDQPAPDSAIVSVFEEAIKNQLFIRQMKGDTTVVDSLPFFWKVSVKKGCFVFSKGGNLLSVNKTAWYSVSVPNVVLILWNTKQSEGTVYTQSYNYEIEKIDNKFKVVAFFKKK